ncbi:hypothetical protein M407DRAFT_5673 [Tulasnella calospora MUT 4182]|uniref:Cleavage/polyadenylation specificity factor A subunit N-terminal domain-containing protein n=1 Tax=Tulasnella calospora MUT 4182 TaxID=1051891 RepID=A0A0C3QFQ6_9AGAM|nr:hypothetical protein M407DRAFT_5673 [Tulasnella calospora MUT 4182]
MHLYNLTLQPPTAICGAPALGNFSGVRQQEIVVSRGTRLELLRPDPNTGKVSSVLTQDVFGVIRSLASFRLTGGTKDYVIVTSDSGRIVVLEYDPKANVFNKLHQETFGKSGTRRIVPGQYLATDPKGRAVMISAVEKAKLVYILNRDAAANLTISSPLEAHKSHAIIHHIVGVDVGFDNPMFAALEVDYSESDQDPTGEAFNNAEKMLTFYELDLGLNHVVRKWSEPTDNRANLLVQVPGGRSGNTGDFDGPSGVLICCEDHIIWRDMDSPQHRVPIPWRDNPLADPNRGVIIVATVMHKMRGAFFFLLQSEEGDLYKVTLEHETIKNADSDDAYVEVKSLKIKYFDTVPVAAGLSILKSGYLFVASEFGNQSVIELTIGLSYLYQFQKLGDDDDEPEWSSSNYPQNGMADPHTALPAVHFRPRPLENLLLQDEMESLDPIIDAKVLNFFNTDTPQIFAACGRGARSTFRTLRHGLDVEETVTSDLPGIPNAVWTTKIREDDPHDSYIILSFVNGTLVLSIGETIEEVSDTGFLSSAPTLAVQQIGADALLQVHPHGIRHVLADKRVNEWKVPAGKTIVAATTNKRQVVAALSSAELVYFELDLEGQLNEYQDRKPMGSTVLTMSVGPVPPGRQRTPYLKKLLRKCENKAFPSAIVTLTTQGSRILVGDMQESVFYVTYKQSSNRLLIFADDTSPRWITSHTMVDYETFAAGDKFGNVFISRLDRSVSSQVDEDPTGAGILAEKGFLMGAAHKTKLLAIYHVGDVVTSIQKVSMVAGGREILLYTGLHGTIGTLVPLVSKEDVDFITTLEQHLRGENQSLIGRDMLSYRGYYTPVKAVVDGKVR